MILNALSNGNQFCIGLVEPRRCKRQAASLCANSGKMPESHDRAAATGTGASGAAETVIASHDLAIFDLARIDVP